MSNIMRVSALNKMLKNIKNYEEKLKNDSEQSPTQQSPQISETNVLKETEQKQNGNVLNFDIVEN